MAPVTARIGGAPALDETPEERCINQVRKWGAKMCSEQHCNEAQNHNHEVCNCEGPYINGCEYAPRPGCCGYHNNSPVYVATSEGGCFCCCSCFANGTMIATSGTTVRQIQDFLIGDPVWVALDASLSKWVDAPVEFSAGTGSGSDNAMIRIRYGDPDEPGVVYASRDQLFLMDDRKLKRALKLVPGSDHLVQPDGGTLPILDLAAGQYDRGVHHIATGVVPTPSVKGHLLVANGVVGGDYALQVSSLERDQPDLLVDGHEDLPDFGTDEYAAAYGNLQADPQVATASSLEAATAPSPGFIPFASEKAVHVPEAGSHFLTHRQARDVQENGVREAVYTGSADMLLSYLFSLLNGFYPDVRFYHDAGNELPNAYAFREFDVPFVVITGGLARNSCLSFEGLAVILAQGVAHFRHGDPSDAHGYICTGACDFAATAAILPEVFFTYRSWEVVQKGIEQVKGLFELIDPEHRHGETGNTCDRISIECRIEALEAGGTSSALPECAGGPPAPTLQVSGASGRWDGDQAEVTVTFNEPIDPASVGIGCFSFSPIVVETAARGEGDEVTVSGKFEPATDYAVSVFQVVSATGHPLVPVKSKAQFEMPARKEA